MIPGKFIRTVVLLSALSAIQVAFAQQKANDNYSFDHLPTAAVPVFKTDTFNIKDYGARDGGRRLNTESINKAIETCSNKGGGVVLVPSGTWLTGPVVLRSNVNLYLDHKAVLLFTRDFSKYKLIKTNWEGLPAVRNESPVSGLDLENVGITGHGIIDASGDAWRMVKKDKVPEAVWNDLVMSGGQLSDDKKTWYPSEQSYIGSKTKEPGVITSEKNKIEDFTSIKDFLRPNLLVLNNCKKILIKGIVFQNSPAWTLHFLMCQDLTIDGAAVKNPWYAQNGDGIDIESCKNVVLENSTFAAGDDGICIKSGKDIEGRKRGIPTENLVVRNCIVYRAHGGFVIGSEMSGGARNIFVTDCSFIGTDVGLRFKTRRGRGGVVENIFVRNITMKKILGQAILFDMYYEAKDPIALAGEKRTEQKRQEVAVSEGTPRFRNFYISNVNCDGADRAIFVRGLPEMDIENIYLEHMKLATEKGIEVVDAKNIVLRDIHVELADTNPVVLINNASDLTFDDISYNANPAKLFSVGGVKSSNINVLNTKMPANRSEVLDFYDGATARSLNIK